MKMFVMPIINKWSYGVNSVSKTKFRNSSKPFWNDELIKWWKKLCTAESEYLPSLQMYIIRRNILNKFKQNQNIFDKSFHKAKRKF